MIMHIKHSAIFLQPQFACFKQVQSVMKHKSDNMNIQVRLQSTYYGLRLAEENKITQKTVDFFTDISWTDAKNYYHQL